VKILLLEDNKRLNNTITKRLSLIGYDIHSFTDGEEALKHIDDGYNCFILDINVPNIDGVELLKKIREYHTQIPVIIISSTVELDVIKDAYSFGCDEYLKKPFYIDELEIKIQKLCKIDDSLLQIAPDCLFDITHHTLRYDSEQTSLTKKESLLLQLLLTQRGTPVSFETIQSVVWEGNPSSIDSVRTLIKRLRKLLPDNTIQTVINFGYKI
jgi:DNA-binding response OmpR family regulator